MVFQIEKGNVKQDELQSKSLGQRCSSIELFNALDDKSKKSHDFVIGCGSAHVSQWHTEEVKIGNEVQIANTVM